MTPMMALCGIAAFVAFGLTPVLYRYQGRLSGRVSGFGFTAEIVVDGRDEEAEAQLPGQKRLDGD